MAEADLLSAYRAALADGHLVADPCQEQAAHRLQALLDAVRHHTPAARERGLAARLGLGRKATVPPPGVYLYGPVGRGKSMLMDLFHRTVPVTAARRLHFQDFMRLVHKRLHAYRQDKRTRDDPLPPLARALARESWLLCLDELEVRDVADAMIVGRLFKGLLDAGAVLVITSNRPPDELYHNGLQRERFLPFVDLIKDRLNVVDLGPGTDYRRQRLAGMPVYHAPNGPGATAALDTAFERLTGGQAGVPETVRVHGRDVPVPRAAGGVARFAFADLCQQPLAQDDYAAIAARFDTLLVDDVPVMGPEQADAARRFILLVDALYEHHTALVASAEAAPDALDAGAADATEFARTVSRLHEMQSADWAGQPHVA